jgi:hypothetical protein
VGARRVYEIYPAHGIFETVTTFNHCIDPWINQHHSLDHPSDSSWSSISADVHDAGHVHVSASSNKFFAWERLPHATAWGSAGDGYDARRDSGKARLPVTGKQYRKDSASKGTGCTS